MISRDNFYINTTVKFIQVDGALQSLRRVPDYISYRKNKRGKTIPSSQYWFCSDEGGDYVYRMSSHWCNIITSDLKVTTDCEIIKDCIWDIQLLKDTYYQGTPYIAKAYFSDFKQIN